MSGRRLPLRPHLDQLKRQAKDLLQAIRRSDAAAVAELLAAAKVRRAGTGSCRRVG
jgi:hypothetical protein